jgi:hypothetical protein
VFLVDDIHTLVDMVITNLTLTYLVFCVVSSHRVATMVVVQAKDGLYHDQHPMNPFFPSP